MSRKSSPGITPILDRPNPWDRLLAWMEERQRIYLNRQAGKPWPWTDDPYLRRYRYCNVYREQDKVTVWIRKNWRDPYAQHPNLWFAMALARMINWPPSLDAVDFPERWCPKRVVRILQDRKDSGLKVFTGAYMVCCGPNTVGQNKTHYLAYNVLNPIWKASRTKRQEPPWDLRQPTLEAASLWFRQFDGFGPFLSYEIVTDMRHTRYLCRAPDIMTWAGFGPGCRRGLNRLMDRPVNQSLRPKQAVEEMQQLLTYCLSHRDPAVLPALEIRDIEMSCCEYDKYCRAAEGAERGLERFNGPAMGVHAL